MRHRLRGDTEQGLDFIHQRIYAIGLAQQCEVLQNELLSGLLGSNLLRAIMKIDTARFLRLFKKHERVCATDVEHS